ncbi:MAG: DNA-directed RNA polymerase subunit omega [Kiritimatiellae bacterium]|nr:DNA-directed RNA polymerase subunit omega [Kiritimatiellia bacterium]MBQ9345623.1 DNA-directed RNA polymerase subunit omega [Kiritimatiellia bacterium]
MNAIYLEKAKEKMPNVPLLINTVSKRVRQLIAGQRPMVKRDFKDQELVDIVLKEIAEDKLIATAGALSSSENDVDTNDLFAL